MKWRYTNIQHPPRIAMGLTPNEYCVLDVIYQSQVHPRYSFDGWARVGCHKIASFLGFSSGAVHKMFERFEGWGLLEFDETRQYKRTTSLWYDVAYIEDAESEQGVQKLNSVQKVNRRGSKSEQTSVQKVNVKCSKSEPITNKPNFKAKEVRKRARFQPPKLTDVFSYMLEKTGDENFARRESEKFLNYYESNGWKVGRNKMKSWPHAVGGWIARADNYAKPQKNGRNGSEKRIGACTEDTLRRAYASLMSDGN